MAFSCRTGPATPRRWVTRSIQFGRSPTGSCRSSSPSPRPLRDRAIGGETVKLPYGHRGGNHPVRDIATGQVLITSQNHGFAVRGETGGVPGAKSLEVTHLNLNDGTVEGIKHREYPIFAVQYHPEASPG